MLVGPDEKNLKRALDSVAPWINPAVFQFNASEGSIRLRDEIYSVFQGTAVTYDCTFKPWENFSVNRNALIASAKAMSSADFLLTMDADDQFVFANTFKKSQLTADYYNVNIFDNGDIQYPRTMFWRSSMNVFYTEPAHECLNTVGGRDGGQLPNVGYVRHPKILNADETKAKYLRDAKILLDEIRKNPENTRATYYCAQSIEDTNDPRPCSRMRWRSVRTARWKMTHGYPDEAFVSLIKVGRIRAAMKEPEKARSAWAKAQMLLPARGAEAAFEIAHWYNNEGYVDVGSRECARSWAGAYVTPMPVPTGFRVDASVYKWKLLFEEALGAYYQGDKTAAKALFEKLLPVVPPEQKPVIESNLKWCEPAVAVEAQLIADLDKSLGNPVVVPAPPKDAIAVAARAHEAIKVSGVLHRRAVGARRPRAHEARPRCRKYPRVRLGRQHHDLVSVLAAGSRHRFGGNGQAVDRQNADGSGEARGPTGELRCMG